MNEDNALRELLAPGEAGGHESGPGPDPLDAVMAVAENRAAPADGAGERETAPLAVTVETHIGLQPGAENAPAEPEQEDYFGDFAWPDGFTADPGALAKFSPLAKRLRLSRESAHELARLYADLDQAKQTAQAEFVAKNNTEWLREIHNHPEFGGRNLNRTAQSVGNLLRRFGSPMLSAQMRQMNVQNWPEMFYFLARVAQAQAEDCSPACQPGQGVHTSTARLLFPGLK